MLNTNQQFKNTAIGNRSLYQLKQKDIKDIQQLLLHVMDDVVFVCTKYNLTYILCGGTALGAVRHGGFIPWDEDMDFCMPRHDYNLFREKFLCEFGDKYWVQDVKSSSKYDLNFMKIRIKGTRYVELFEPDLSQAGIFVDIFPLENTYDSFIGRRIHGIISEGLLFICSCVRMRAKEKKLLSYAENSKKLYNSIKIKSEIGLLFSFLKLKKWLLITEKCLSMCSNENSKYVMIPTGRGHYFGEIYTRESFLPGKKVKFEDREYYIQKNADEYLSKLYGEYMKIPPEDKRERHSVVEYFIRVNDNDNNKKCE